MGRKGGGRAPAGRAATGRDAAQPDAVARAASTEGRLERLIEVSRALMSTRDTEEVVSRILAAGIELFDAEGCSLALVDDSRRELGFVAMEGAAKTAPFRIPLGKGVAGYVVSHREPVVVLDTEADPRFDSTTDLRTGFRTRAIAAVPIEQSGRVVGVVEVLNCRCPGGFSSSRDLPLLSALAALAGAALNRARDDDRLRNASELWRQERDERHQLVVSRSGGMQQVVRMARTAARADSTILLLGESGTGKELLARTIHQHSARREGPFIAINCVALSPSLLESELFGHEKGAFTGATQSRKGKFELAAGGTLFLDEIGELSVEFQTKLLRVLQEREIERVGGNTTIQVDVRLIAATNRDLRAAIEARQFREDLYYRLNVVTLEIPPLRQRREDIGGLCIHFLARACRAVKRAPMKLATDATDLLGAYDWPGNVRELANLMERLAVLCEGDTVSAGDLSPELHRARTSPKLPVGGATPRPLTERVAEFKRDAVREALRAAEGSQRGAAALLGIEQSNLSRLMKSLGLR